MTSAFFIKIKIKKKTNVKDSIFEASKTNRYA